MDMQCMFSKWHNLSALQTSIFRIVCRTYCSMTRECKEKVNLKCLATFKNTLSLEEKKK